MEKTEKNPTEIISIEDYKKQKRENLLQSLIGLIDRLTSGRPTHSDNYQQQLKNLFSKQYENDKRNYMKEFSSFLQGMIEEEIVINVDLELLEETFENILIDVLAKNENLQDVIKTRQQDYFALDQLGRKLEEDYKIKEKLKSVIFLYYYY